MIIDSSAIIAVINGEPEAIGFANAIAATVCRISAVNYVEAAIVADNRGEAMRVPSTCLSTRWASSSNQ